ncbi:hypothetical protein LEBR102806_01375 [Levilactobacillus brevis]|uniref:Uncharacterized protein n=1 Tax=Levilactobacillus brevis ATCC 14869 = DSM 20054 TaxID=649758 RepID=U2R2D6_LEVBR|nr:hypothetical protein [Levilactobacillus brevis]ERK44842.1 hypothetical protein HMPREF0495_00640 [Levilactobacillus brevis ATCC 14869 = DSM 20054]MCT3571186.1 hypothetical protein [Levilactobacillus brevis]MCT3572096.1 hypothetical protein [Levilactobacillus brevis]SQG82127.1 Uncharacterised protein [Levilactobacillus brevis]
MNKPNSNRNTISTLALLSFISSVLVFFNRSILYSLILIGFAGSNIILSSSTSGHANSTLPKNGPVVSDINVAIIKRRLSGYYVTVNAYLIATSFLHLIIDGVNKAFPKNDNCAWVLKVTSITLMLVVLSIFFEVLFVGVNRQFRKYLDRKINRENESE